MKHKLELFYNQGKLEMVGILLNEFQYYTADVRCFIATELCFVIKVGSPCKLFSKESLTESVNIGYYNLRELEIEVNIQPDTFYTYCYIDPIFRELK